MESQQKRQKVAMNVVLFKSESEGPDKFLKILENSEFNGISIPCLSFQFKNLEKLEEKLKTLDDYEGIIFTSPRTVKAVQEASKSHPEMRNCWKTKQNFSVGESTNLAAKNLLDLETSGHESGNAQKLSELIIEKYKSYPPRKFLCPSGNLKLDILETNLTEASMTVDHVEVYETIAHPELATSINDLKCMKIEFLIFFSPSGVNFALSELTKNQLDLKNFKIIAIGPTTQKSLEDRNLKCFAVCTKPTPESLLNALRSATT